MNCSVSGGVSGGVRVVVLCECGGVWAVVLN